MNLALLILLVISAVYGEQFSTLFSSDIDVSEGCRTAVQRLSTLQATKPQLMAHYWDSWGKPSDSLLTGHTTFLGYYDECINLKNTDLGDMKYCIYPMTMDTSIIQRPSKSDDGVCHSSNCPVLDNTSSVLNVKVGVCYPSVCSTNEFAVVLSKMNITSVTTVTSNPFSDTTNTITITLNSREGSSPFCPYTDVEYDTGTIIFIVVCAILVGLVVVGTIVDVVLWLLSSCITVTSEADDKKANKFSFWRNTKIISKEKLLVYPTIKDFILAFSLKTTACNLMVGQSSSALKALGGIRIMSTLTIIMLHIYQLTPLFFPATSQNPYLKHISSKLIFQPIMSVNFALESLFVLSGTVSAYLTFKDVEKHKRFRFKYFYLSRFFRLLPLLYLYIFIAYKLSPQYGEGPMWYSPVANACKTSWWYSLLFLTNTISVNDMCLPNTWHFSADMQLFLFSPIFMMFLYHAWCVGLVVIVMTMTVATATVGYVSVANGYWAAIYYNPQVLNQLSGLHVQAFYRANSYLIGILLGYILYKQYNIAALPIKNCSKWLIYTLLWVIGIMLCLVTMFGTYGEYSFAYHFSSVENVTFLMFSGLAWSIGIAIIIYICNTGYGGVMNSFLSWPGWELLVKLNYGVTLCNPLVLFYIVGTLQSSLKFTNTVFAMLAVFTVVLSYSVSAVTAVFVDQPLSQVVLLCFKMVGIETRSK